jgi:hypothetical protein
MQVLSFMQPNRQERDSTKKSNSCSNFKITLRMLRECYQPCFSYGTEGE